MKKRVILELVLLILLLTLKSVFLVPAVITGGIAGNDYIGYVSIFSLSNVDPASVDMITYNVLYVRYILENIIILVAGLFIIFKANKLLK